MSERRDPSLRSEQTEGKPMQTTDRLRMFRSLGLAIAALLLIGGVVVGSQALSGQRHDDAAASPGASAEVRGDEHDEDATASEDASESPEASPEENEDINDDDARESPEASEDEAESEAEDASGSADPSESPDDDGSNSGPGGDDSHDD